MWWDCPFKSAQLKRIRELKPSLMTQNPVVFVLYHIYVLVHSCFCSCVWIAVDGASLLSVLK